MGLPAIQWVGARKQVLAYRRLVLQFLLVPDCCKCVKAHNKPIKLLILFIQEEQHG